MAKQRAAKKSKYKSADEKRKARNERVRIRRAKQRAERRKLMRKLRKAAKALRGERRRIPRRETDLAAVVPPPPKPKHVGIAVYAESVDLLVNGSCVVSSDYAKPISEYVGEIQNLAIALGATVHVHDLRVPE